MINWLRVSAFGLVVLVIIVIAIIAFYAPDKLSNSADPSAIIERVQAAQDLFSDYELVNVSVVDEITIVKAEFTGTKADAPRESVAWHQAAETIANRLYYEVVKNRTVQVEVYENSEFRAVAVAGL